MTPRKGMTMTLAAMLLAVVGVTMARAQIGTPPFVPQMLSQLAKDGWTPQEINALDDAASRLDWSGTAGAGPDVVAMSLELAKSEDPQLSATDQAQLALQVALAADQMKSAGFEAHSVAIAALGAVRNVLAEIQGWMAGGRQGSLGQIIRNSVADAVRQQGRAMAGAQSAGRGPDGQGPAGPGVPSFVDTPASGGVPPLPPHHGR